MPIPYQPHRNPIVITCQSHLTHWAERDAPSVRCDLREAQAVELEQQAAQPVEAWQALEGEDACGSWGRRLTTGHLVGRTGEGAGRLSPEG